MDAHPGKFQPPIFSAAETTRALLAERRGASRIPVIKSAKLTVGEGYSQGVFNCLVLDESAGGVLVDLGSIFILPEEAVLHMMGGAACRVRRRWAVGSKMGLEFVGEQIVSAETTQEMAAIARLIRTQGLPAGIAALRAQRYFGQAELKEAAEAAETSFYRLKAMLQEE